MLQGIRVVEIEGLGPGPFAAMMLADLGAEVIVIHRPGAGNPVAGKANLLDRGKKSIVLDLKLPADLAVITSISLEHTAILGDSLAAVATGGSFGGPGGGGGGGSANAGGDGGNTDFEPAQGNGGVDSPLA